MSTEMDPARQVIEGLRRAINSHDIEKFVAFFDPDYVSEQPAHPARYFKGQAQVRENWTTIFASTPDLTAELLTVAIDGHTVFAEWRWFGTQAGGGRFDWRGVTVMGIQGGAIAWGRLYMEPVEEAGDDITATVRGMTEAPETTRP